MALLSSPLSLFVLTKEPILSRFQNFEPIKMIVGKAAAAAAKPPTIMDVKDKRKAFGDIENRIG